LGRVTGEWLERVILKWTKLNYVSCLGHFFWIYILLSTCFFFDFGCAVQSR
jgi:hypothetical protein